MEFFLLPHVAPFTAALLGVGLVGAIELLGVLLIGVAGLTHAVNCICHTHTHVHVDAPPFFMADWVVVRNLPLMATLVAMLSGFGVAGLAAQALTSGIANEIMSLPAAASIGVAGALGFVRALSAVFKRLKLESETTAVSLQSLVGKTAVLQSPVARIGYAGEALVKDEYGTTHYVMVEPAVEGEDLIGQQEFELVDVSPDNGTFRGRRLK